MLQRLGHLIITATEEQFLTRKEDQQTSNKKKYQKKQRDAQELPKLINAAPCTAKIVEIAKGSNCMELDKCNKEMKLENMHVTQENMKQQYLFN